MGLPIHLCEADLLTSRQHMSLGHLALVDELVNSLFKHIAPVVVVVVVVVVVCCF